MSVMIRLSRAGTNKKPFFYVLVTDKACRRDGNYIAKIGSYDPRAKEQKDKLKVDMEALKAWQAKGALMTETVASVLKATAK